MPTPASSPAIRLELQPPALLLWLYASCTLVTLLLIGLSRVAAGIAIAASGLVLLVVFWSYRRARRRHCGELLFEKGQWSWLYAGQRQLLRPGAAFYFGVRTIALQFGNVGGWPRRWVFWISPDNTPPEQARALRVLIQTGYF
ncbi:protein YgfX [Halioxenophilus sp. WMMB6]|uniref:protein YgfX n=1 Tax=Halioxenophilus sp. WMMB6 TaxID=3073815 RepID=UPI00295EFE6C|nr:protein YgfX [Halioxenophilus sp. WMMB6]